MENCSGTGDQCNADSTFDPAGAEGNCDTAGATINEGLPCDDTLACNVGETCQTGVCTGGAAQDCTGTGDQCNADSTCDPAGAEGNCDTAGATINEGLPCDDMLACNEGQTCQTGVCTCGTAPEGDRVTICHVPPDSADGAHTITIPENAVPSHLAHGDSLGPCPDDDDDDSDDDDDDD